MINESEEDFFENRNKLGFLWFFYLIFNTRLYRLGSGETCCRAVCSAFVGGSVCSPGKSPIVKEFLMPEKFEIFGIRPGFARAMIDLEDDTPLPGSRLLCLTSLSPLILRVIFLT